MHLSPYKINKLKIPAIKQVILLDQCSSTLDFALNWQQDRTLFITESQTKGRGKNNKIWLSPPNTGIWATFLLKTKASALAIKSAIALANALKELGCPEPIQIKWPNDLYLNGKKTAGILIEGSIIGNNQLWAIGIGITYNDVALPDIMPLSQHWPNACSREQLITTWIKQLLFIIDTTKIAQSFDQLNFLKGKKYSDGIVLGINDAGHLLIQTHDQVLSIT